MWNSGCTSSISVNTFFKATLKGEERFRAVFGGTRSNLVSDPTHEFVVFCASAKHRLPFSLKDRWHCDCSSLSGAPRQSRLPISFEREPVHYLKFPTGVGSGSQYEYQSAQ